MNIAYFWDGKEVHVVTTNHPVTSYTAEQLEHLGRECVDTSCMHPDQRYGLFVQTSMSPGWQSKPFEDFDKEFRVHLLLLGVS